MINKSDLINIKYRKNYTSFIYWSLISSVIYVLKISH